jgi:hypothetical protein
MHVARLHPWRRDGRRATGGRRTVPASRKRVRRDDPLAQGGPDVAIGADRHARRATARSGIRDRSPDPRPPGSRSSRRTVPASRKRVRRDDPLAQGGRRRPNTDRCKASGRSLSGRSLGPDVAIGADRHARRATARSGIRDPWRRDGRRATGGRRTVPASRKRVRRDDPLAQGGRRRPNHQRVELQVEACRADHWVRM